MRTQEGTKKGLLNSPFNLTGTETTRTDLHPARLTAEIDPNRLNIDHPATTGMAIGVAHVVTGHGATPAAFTNFCHVEIPP